MNLSILLFPHFSTQEELHMAVVAEIVKRQILTQEYSGIWWEIEVLYTPGECRMHHPFGYDKARLDLRGKVLHPHV